MKWTPLMLAGLVISGPEGAIFRGKIFVSLAQYSHFRKTASDLMGLTVVPQLVQGELLGRVWKNFELRLAAPDWPDELVEVTFGTGCVVHAWPDQERHEGPFLKCLRPDCVVLFVMES